MEWISVKDDLPKCNEAVLVFYESPLFKNPSQSVAIFFDGVKWRQLIGGFEMESPVTHWMPLPDPPKHA